MKKTVQNLQEFKTVVAEWSHSVQKPAIICLNGAMGAGKTTFVRFFCEAHGVSHVTSPTYALHHQYKSKIAEIDHWDLYRTENEDELESTGFWENIFHNRGVIFIEWSSRIDLNHLPQGQRIHSVQITQSLGDSRTIEIVETAPLT